MNTIISWDSTLGGDMNSSIIVTVSLASSYKILIALVLWLVWPHRLLTFNVGGVSDKRLGQFVDTVNFLFLE